VCASLAWDGEGWPGGRGSGGGWQLHMSVSAAGPRQTSTPPLVEDATTMPAWHRHVTQAQQVGQGR
jgi:hypothetical protein